MSIRMEEKWRRRIAVLLAAVLLLSLGGQHTPVVNAATGFVSHNIHHEDYYEDSGNWASNVKSYLYQNRDGSITRVEAVDSSIIVETYNSSTFALQGSQTTIPMDLPLFGGFYAGDDYNYIFHYKGNGRSARDRRGGDRGVGFLRTWAAVRLCRLQYHGHFQYYDHGGQREHGSWKRRV